MVGTPPTRNSNRWRHIVSRPFLMVFALVGLCLTAQTAAAKWPTTAWIVSCTDATARSIGKAACQETGVGAAALHRRQLELASRWLDSLGFRAPAVNCQCAKPEKPYWAEIADEELGPDVGGSYRRPHDPDQPRTGTFYLSSDIAGASLGGESVHELFHAVEQVYHPLGPLYARLGKALPYPPPAKLAKLLPDLHWITEGTADAIRIAFGQHTGQHFKGRPTRQYDSSLNYPCGVCSIREQRLQTYQTANFWLALGEMLGSRDRVQYLTKIWEAIGVDPDLAHQGVDAVDRGLRAVDGKGLVFHFPAFIAKYADDAKHFAHVEDIALHGTTETESRMAQVEPIAADAYRVRVYVPKGQKTKLRMEFAADAPYLHLIVDGRRLDAATAGKDRNIFHRSLSGRKTPYEFFVRVANVAKHAADSKKRTYTLKVSEPSKKLAGNLVAEFHGLHKEGGISLSEQTSVDWHATLKVDTGPAETKNDPFEARKQLIYPDNKSMWSFHGRFKDKLCQTMSPNICNYWIHGTFSADGSIADSGGKLRIVSADNGLVLETQLPVTVTTTVHDSPRTPDRTETHTEKWALQCAYAPRSWWGIPQDQVRHLPDIGSLAGRWASDAHQVIEFDCHKRWQPQQDSGSNTLTIHGRVKVSCHDTAQSR